MFSPRHHWILISPLKIYFHSKFLWEGSRRVGVSANQETALEFSAFIRPDGSVVLIVLNRSSSVIQFEVWDPVVGYIPCAAPAHSLLTLAWNTQWSLINKLTHICFSSNTHKGSLPKQIWHCDPFQQQVTAHNLQTAAYYEPISVVAIRLTSANKLPQPMWFMFIILKFCFALILIKNGSWN